MTHRSRLQSVVVDCDDLDKNVAFWTAALGAGVVGRDEQYVVLEPVCGELRFLLQRVPEGKSVKGRVHLDIESDDIEAEARRLEQLGATRIGPVEDWVVMLDPCGNEFCVVKNFSPWFEASAKTWEE